MIRLARSEDAEGIAVVHAGAWQAAYRAIVPAVGLEPYTVANRRKYWAEARLGERPPDCPIFVAIAGDAIAGFAVCGPPRDPGIGYDAEIYAINVAPEHWRRGFGRELFVHCADDLSARGHGSFYLWVFTANERARRFYEKLGGALIEGHLRSADFDGIGVLEIAYGWLTMPRLAGGTGV